MVILKGLVRFQAVIVAAIAGSGRARGVEEAARGRASVVLIRGQRKVG